MWTAADPGPPYNLAVALGRTDADISALKKVIADNVRVVGWCPTRRGHAVAAVTNEFDHGRSHTSLARAARAASLLVAFDGPLHDATRLGSRVQAVLAVEDALRRAGCAEAGVAGPVEVAALEALSTIPLRSRVGYIRQTLGPILALPAARANRLLETLHGLAQGLSVNQLASALHLHPKTLGLRRRRIAVLTGLEPWSPPGRFQLVLGFLLWRLAGDDVPPVGSANWRVGTF